MLTTNDFILLGVAWVLCGILMFFILSRGCNDRGCNLFFACLFFWWFFPFLCLIDWVFDFFLYGMKGCSFAEIISRLNEKTTIRWRK